MTPQTLEPEWQDLSVRAGMAAPDARVVFRDLCRRYSEPGRAYHTIDHVAAMLDTVSGLGGAVRDDAALRLAVWFHDAVYDSRRSDNEEQSAALAVAALGRSGLSPRFLPTVERLILATKTHQAPPDDMDCRILLDADLAVLGASAAAYDRYAQAIREEYAWVPKDDYRAGRRRVLEGFLGRDRLFQTDKLFGEREQAARANLRREIERLTDREEP